jgi:hypothetical protein
MGSLTGHGVLLFVLDLFNSSSQLADLIVERIRLVCYNNNNKNKKNWVSILLFSSYLKQRGVAGTKFKVFQDRPDVKGCGLLTWVFLVGLHNEDIESNSLFCDGRESVAEAVFVLALLGGNMVIGSRGSLSSILDERLGGIGNLCTTTSIGLSVSL